MLERYAGYMRMLQPLVELILRFHGVSKLCAVRLLVLLLRHLLADRKAVGEYFH